MTSLPAAIVAMMLIATIAVWFAFVLTQRGNAKMARRLLWIGAMGPYLVTVGKEVEDVAAGLTAIDAVRGGLPIVCYVTARLLAETPRLPWGGTERALATFLAVALGSTLWSVSPTTTFLKAVALAFTYLNLLELRRHYRTRDAAISGLAALVHLLLLLAIVQIPLKATAAWGFRMGLVYPNVASNLFAYIAVAGLLLVSLGIGPRWTVQLPARVLLAAIYLIELLATRTRSALLIGILIIAITAIRAARYAPWPVVVACFVCASIIILVVSSPEAIKEFLLRGQNAQGVLTLTGRTTIWEIGLDGWHQSPLLGLGYYAGHRLGLQLPNNYSNLDNTWIETLVDLGLLGTVPLALYVLGGLGRALRRGADDPRLAILVAALAVYGVGVSFVNPSVQDVNTNQLLMAMLFLFAPANKDAAAISAPQQATRLGM